MTHCATCNCRDDEKPAQPSTASRWAIEAAKKAAADAVAAAREKRKKPAAPADTEEQQ